MSQLEKFNRKWGKSTKYAKIVEEGELHREFENQYGDIKGVEELMEKGNIKEAAAVFSNEGLSFFARLIEQTLDKQLITNGRMESIIERVIDRKITEALMGMSQGLQTFMSGIAPVDTAFETLKKSMTASPNIPMDRAQKVMNSAEQSPTSSAEYLRRLKINKGILRPDEEMPVSNPAPIKSCKPRKKYVRSDVNQATMLVEVLKENSHKAMTAGELRPLIQEKYGVEIKELSNLISKTLKVTPEITRISKGLYQFKSADATVD
jgi:hypothetical protein